MPSFKRQTERKVSAQAVIRKIKTFCFGCCDYRENWASRAPFCNQIFDIFAGGSGMT
jgi:hypothetical protein